MDKFSIAALHSIAVMETSSFSIYIQTRILQHFVPSALHRKVRPLAGLRYWYGRQPDMCETSSSSPCPAHPLGQLFAKSAGFKPTN